MAEKKEKDKIEAKNIPATEPKLDDEDVSLKAEVKEVVEPKNEFLLKEMSIVDLMQYRKACAILRDYYANSLKIAPSLQESKMINAKYNKYNSKLSRVMLEIENRIDKLSD